MKNTSKIENKCNKPSALDMSEFMDYIRPMSLTIKDIESLKPKQSIKVLVLDRNFDEFCCKEETNKSSTHYKPEHFFRENTATYVHAQNMKGKLTFHGIDYTRDFEFDVEYDKDCWYPLEDGCLPKEDEQKLAPFSFPEPKPYTDFPTTTRVGWRGPMILWEKVKELPDIYWGVEYWLGDYKYTIIDNVVKKIGKEWFGDVNDFKWESLSSENGQKIMEYFKESDKEQPTIKDWLTYQEKTVKNEKDWIFPLYINEFLEIILFENN